MCGCRSARSATSEWGRRSLSALVRYGAVWNTAEMTVRRTDDRADMAWWAPPATADGYQRHYQTEVCAHLNMVSGFRGARLLRRVDDEEVMSTPSRSSPTWKPSGALPKTITSRPSSRMPPKQTLSPLGRVGPASRGSCRDGMTIRRASRIIIVHERVHGNARDVSTPLHPVATMS